MPRSPSRDLSDRFIGRRGYFRSPDGIRRGRRALTVVAILAAVAWAVVDVAKPAQRVQYSHSHGRLAIEALLLGSSHSAAVTEDTVRIEARARSQTAPFTTGNMSTRRFWSAARTTASRDPRVRRGDRSTVS